MKFKVTSVLARTRAFAQSGATALKHGAMCALPKRFAIAAITTATLTMTPVAAKAQTAPLTELFPILSGVQLTTQQKIQVVELGSQAQSQIGNIVTSEQRNRFRTALAQGSGFVEAIAAMKVTPEQQTQLQGVFRSTQTQLISIFTPAQRQRILENVRSLLQLPSTP